MYYPISKVALKLTENCITRDKVALKAYVDSRSIEWIEKDHRSEGRMKIGLIAFRVSD